MYKKIVWLVVSVLMGLSLVMAACGPAAVEEEEEKEKEQVSVVKEDKKEKETEKEEVVEEEVVEDTGFKYGGTYTDVRTSEPRGFDEAYGTFSGISTSFLTHDMLAIGDWSKGASGTGETSWTMGILAYRADLLTGNLAESWDIPDDGTIVFHIRKGVHFAADQNTDASRLVGGREVTAEDVIYNLKRSFESPRARLYTGFTAKGWQPTSYKALDKYTVELKVRSFLLIEISQFMWTRAPEVEEKYGDHTDWRNSVGTGPFMLKDYVAGSAITYLKNPSYWAKDPVGPGMGNRLPYLDGVRTLIVPDMSTRQAALRTGKIDMLSGISWEDFEALNKSNPEIKFTSTYSVAAMTGRLDKGLPFDDIRVRQALSMAIDREEILEYYYGGHGQVYSFYVPTPDHAPFYVPLEEMPEAVRELWEYHPDKSIELLTEAGYPNGFKTQIVTTGTNVDFYSLVKEYFRKVGVDLEIRVVESGTFNTIGQRRTHEEMISTGLYQTSFPARMLIWDMESQYNRAMFDHPITNKAFTDIKDAMTAQNPDAVSRILKETAPFQLEQSAYIAFPAYKSYRMWQPWAKNYHGESGLGNFGPGQYLQYMWYDQELKKEMGY